jgi:hypothetical protein
MRISAVTGPKILGPDWIHRPAHPKSVGHLPVSRVRRHSQHRGRGPCRLPPRHPAIESFIFCSVARAACRWRCCDCRGWHAACTCRGDGRVAAAGAAHGTCLPCRAPHRRATVPRPRHPGTAKEAQAAGRRCAVRGRRGPLLGVFATMLRRTLHSTTRMGLPLAERRNYRSFGDSIGRMARNDGVRSLWRRSSLTELSDAQVAG